jgi:hypothetical protein
LSPGIHAYAKLKEVYGENMAMTLSSLARTKLILGTADRETATWCSDFIGHRQVRDMEEGYTYGYNNARDAVSLTPRKHIEPLLLPDQLMNLPRLSGTSSSPTVSRRTGQAEARAKGLERAVERTPGKTIERAGTGSSLRAREGGQGQPKDRSNTRTDAPPRKAGPSARPLLPTGEAAAIQDQPASAKGAARPARPTLRRCKRASRITRRAMAPAMLPRAS